MRRNTLLVLLNIFALLLQTVFLTPPLVVCNLTVLFIVYLALERTFRSGLILALLLGYLTDVLVGTDRGLLMLTMVLVFIFIRFLIIRFQGGKAWFVSWISATAAMMSTTLSLVIEMAFSSQQTAVKLFSLSTFSIVITGACFGYPIYRSLRMIDSYFHEPEDDFVFRG